MNLKKVCAILLVLLMVLTVNVSAYSTDSYKVDISEEDYEVVTEDDITMFQKMSGDNIVIQKIEQKIIGGKLTQFQLSAISQEIKKQYEESFGAKVEETGRETVTINGRNVIRMTFKTTLEGHEVLQELNIFVSSDCIYDVIFTRFSEDGFPDDEKNAILNSFEILSETNNNAVLSEENNNNDNETTNSEMNLAWLVIGIVIVIALVLLVIKICKKPKTEKVDIVENQKTETRIEEQKIQDATEIKEKILTEPEKEDSEKEDK